MTEQELREKMAELLHWKTFMFIGQNNAIFEGALTQESEEAIADIFQKAGYKSPEELAEIIKQSAYALSDKHK